MGRFVVNLNAAPPAAYHVDAHTEARYDERREAGLDVPDAYVCHYATCPKGRPGGRA